MERWTRWFYACSAYVSWALGVLALALIWTYRAVLSGWLGSNCRFQPTCSHYAQIAFETHLPIRAFILSARRILKCHPFGSFGFDPVPECRGTLEK